MLSSRYIVVIFIFLTGMALGSEENEKILNIALPSKIQSHDPIKAWSSYQHLLINSVYNTLTRINENGEISANLLDRWKVSVDYKTYWFSLKDNIKFHDGTLLTSHDVAYSLSRHLWKESKSRYRSHLENALGKVKQKKGKRVISQIKILNDKEFTINLPKPYLPLLGMLSQTGLSIVKKDHPLIGTGPFTASFNKKLQIWQLHRFNDHFGDISIYSKVNIFSLFDPKHITNRLASGKLDLAIGQHLRQVDKKEKITKQHLRTLGYNHFFINPKRTKMKQKEFRFLVGRLLQEVAWKSRSNDSYNRPIETLLPKGLLPLNFYSPRPRKMNLKEIISKLNSYSGNLRIVLVRRHFSSSFFEELKSIFKDIKLELNLILIKGPDYMELLESSDFDIISYPFVGTYYDPDGFFLSLENYLLIQGEKGKSSSFSFYIDDIRHISDKNKRLKKYAEALRKIEENWHLVPAYQMRIPILTRSGIFLPETNFRNTLDIWRIKQ